MTDTEIRVKGISALTATLGSVEAERFIALVLREPFDYTRWQENLFEGRSVAEISAEATRFVKEQTEQGSAEKAVGTKESAFENETEFETEGCPGRKARSRMP